MRIKSIAAEKDRAGRYRVDFEDGTIKRLYPQVIEDLGLYPGLDLDESALKALNNKAGEISAKMRAVRMISASAVSRKNLEQKLRQKGESPDNAQNAVSWLEELNLLDDRDTARQIVRRGQGKGYGAARIRQMLYEKGIPKELWAEAMEELPEPDEAICAYLDKNLPPKADYKAKKKVIDALLRRGHRYGDIQRCLRLRDQAFEEYPEDFDG